VWNCDRLTVVCVLGWVFCGVGRVEEGVNVFGIVTG